MGGVVVEGGGGLKQVMCRWVDQVEEQQVQQKQQRDEAPSTVSRALELLRPCLLAAVQRYRPWSATHTPWMTRDSSPSV